MIKCEKYEFSSRQSPGKDFEEIIGYHYLKGLHLNDTNKYLGSRVDRHEHIGKGNLGEQVFKRIMKDERLNGIPMIFETPDENLWKQEVQMLYGFIEQ